MKLYFTKYLPVEGEIKMRDWYFNKYKELCLYQASLPACDYIGAQLAKLFLCSRDIGIGDKFYRKYTKAVGHTPEMECIGMDTTGTVLYSEGINDDIYNPKDLCFKIIGEISPGAIWVKEGDEFDFHQIDAVPFLEGEEYGPDSAALSPELDWEWVIRIQCPTCKKFH